MAHKRCPSGRHVYDTESHTFCPFCPPSPPSIDPLPNKPASVSPPRTNKTTVIIGSEKKESDSSPYSSPTEQTVGWLVVINGNGRGHDLNIPPGQSKIGREKGEIIINFGDTSISREKHAMLAYDPSENTFFIACGDGRNLTKVNGKMLMSTKIINPFDRIRFGNTELLFVPLCCEHFTWEQEYGDSNPTSEPIDTLDNEQK